MAGDPTELPHLQDLPLEDDLSGELSEDELPTAEATDEELGALEPGAGEGGLPDKLYFRIGEVAQIVGVDAHVLRYWESEFRMKPHRSSSGQRLYRKQDLSRFLRIKSLLHNEGYTIAGARKIMSGQASPLPSSGGADAAKLKEVLGLLDGLRRQIRALRDEFDPRHGVDSGRNRS